MRCSTFSIKCTERAMKSNSSRSLLALHLLFVLYSLTDLCGKAAASFDLHDPRFYLLYAALLVVLGLYALGWQQVIKRLPLTTAFSNRAVTVFWGLVWGVIFFHEELSVLKVVGALVVIVGVVLFSRAEITQSSAHIQQKRSDHDAT